MHEKWNNEAVKIAKTGQMTKSGLGLVVCSVLQALHVRQRVVWVLLVHLVVTSSADHLGDNSSIKIRPCKVVRRYFIHFCNIGSRNTNYTHLAEHY